MRQIRFAAIAFVSLVAAIASSFIDPGTFFHRTLSFSLCSVLGLTSNLCYANLARNSGDRAVAAVPPTEQTQNTFPTLDFSPYLQSTRPEFEQPNSSPANLPTSAPQNVPGNSDRRPQVNDSDKTKNFVDQEMMFREIRPQTYEITTTTPNRCQVTRVFNASGSRPHTESIKFNPINPSTCQTGAWLFRFQADGRRVEIQDNSNQALHIEFISPQTVKLTYINSKGQEEYHEFPYTIQGNLQSQSINKALLHKAYDVLFLNKKKDNFSVADIGDEIGDYVKCEICKMTQTVKDIFFGDGRGGTVDDFLGILTTIKPWGPAGAPARWSSSGTALINLLMSKLYDMDESLKLNCESRSFCKRGDSTANNSEQPPINPTPLPQPSPIPTISPDNPRNQPVNPPPPLKPGECLCKWSLNTNRAITRNGVPMVETYDYVTGCDRSPEEVREILRRQGIGTSLSDGTMVNGQVVGEVRRVTSPGDIPGNGCEEDKPKPQPQDGGGTTWGDPHLVTFDGIKYDHHAVGEFILAKSTDSNFEVQVREAAVPASSQVALNTAAAMKVGSTRVAFYVKDFPDSDTTNPLRVDGKPTVIQGGSLSLPGGGSISQVNQGSYIVEWATGERVGVKVDSFGSSALLDINPALPQTRQGQLIGLLGNFNGNPDDDLKSRDGKVLPPQSTINQVSQITQNLTNWVPIPLNQVESLFLEQLHKQFGDSWRISQQESLFDYAPGKNTESYTNRAFPNGFQVLRMLLPAQVQAAEAACRQAGVPSERLEGCLFDVGVTGNADFAKVAANALTNVVKDRIQNEIQQRIPVPVKIPGLPF
jgi:hypothetical protein